jgi:hypothetical protein
VEIADSQQGNELSTVPNSKRRLTLPSQRLLLLDMTRSNLNPSTPPFQPMYGVPPEDDLSLMTPQGSRVVCWHTWPVTVVVDPHRLRGTCCYGGN